MDKRIIVYFTDGLNPPRQLDVSDMVGELIPPITAPENLDGFDSFDNIVLQWDELNRASGYNVYIDGELDPESPVVDAFHTTFLPDGVYEIYVTALAGSIESGPSNMVELTLHSVPQNLIFDQTAPDEASFSWDPVDSVEGYFLYLNGERYNEDPIIGTSVDLEEIDVGQYSAWVTAAFIHFGDEDISESDQSNIVTFTIQPPVEVFDYESQGTFVQNTIAQGFLEAFDSESEGTIVDAELVLTTPVDLEVVVENGEATLTWTTVSAAESYNIYLADFGEPFEKHNTSPVLQEEYIFDQLADGVYSVYVTALRGEEETDPSDSEDFAIGPVPAPENFTVERTLIEEE